MDPSEAVVVFTGLLLGGILKGAVGAGSPVIGVPVIALFNGVPFAVAVFVLPNLMTNIVQGWQYRRSLFSPRFALAFAASGAVGAAIGSVMLANLASETLMLFVAVAVFGFIGFRVAKPGWTLQTRLANRLVVPVGMVGGVLQGAGGISAPVSVTFLSAMKPGREGFIATISVFFIAMSLVQVPALIGLGILTTERALLSVLAMIPLFAGMPLGAWLARKFSAAVFDRTILALLFVIAVKLAWEAL